MQNISKNFLSFIKKMFVITVVFVTIFTLFNGIYVNAAIYPGSSTWPQNPRMEYNENDNALAFPQSYRSYIYKLKEQHPNWIFKAIYTDLDFNDTLRHESYDVNVGISSIERNYASYWKKDGVNNYVDGTYVTASKKAVAYVLDPRNSLNEVDIFQFEALDFNNEASSENTINNMLKGTLMQTYPNKYKREGNWVTLENSLTWAKLIINAGKSVGGSGISAVFLASRMRQETGLDLANNGSINGSSTNYPGVYNFFNIGASDVNNSVTVGLEYAKNQGWTTPQKSINAGAYHIWSSYIKYAQNTVYFQKFDVNNQNNNAKALYVYQYMTNILAPKQEATLTYNAYKESDMLNSSFVFYIPVYNNMPEIATPHPGSYDQTINNDVVYLSGSSDGKYNVYTSPSSSSLVLSVLSEGNVSIDEKTKFVRTYKGNNGYDRIMLPDGREGYIYQTYVKDVTDNSKKIIKVGSMKLESKSYSIYTGQYLELEPIFTPILIKDKSYDIIISNTNIAKVENGKIKGINNGSTEVTLKTKDGSNKIFKFTLYVGKKVVEIKNLNVSNTNVINNISSNTKVSKIKQNIITSYNIKFYNKDLKELNNDDTITTGSVVKILDNSSKEMSKYIISVNGDISGDSLIDSADLLKLRRYLLKIDSFKDYEFLSADINKDGVIDSGDLLRMRQHLLKIKSI